MRTIIGFLLVILILASCADKEPTGSEMKLSGTVNGLKRGTLILQRLQDTLLVSVDSVVVDGNANFEMNTVVESPQIYFLYLRLNTGTLVDDRIPFFAEPGEIVLNTSLKSFGNKARISGSVNQQKLEEYEKLVSRYTDKNLDLIEAQFEARREGNDSLFSELQREQSKILAGKYLATVNFAFNNKDLEVAPYLMLSEVYDANVKYLDTVYGALNKEVKDSKYGKELKALISDRKD